MSVNYEDDSLKLQVFVSGFANNAWLLTDKASDGSIIIDTPANPGALLAASTRTNVVAILITHNHSDHLEGFDDVIREHPVPVGIGDDDALAIGAMLPSGRTSVADGKAVRFGGQTVMAIATPGHTPGSTCYLYEGATRHLFSGDTLFPGGPGRTGSPQNLNRIVKSITTRLLTLPADTVVHPGHGDDTDIATAQAEYAVFAAASHPEGLSGDVTWLGE
jgi:glyoxylase-like metal-dependent hydrolase (beta-lactamase superfamily II)